MNTFFSKIGSLRSKKKEASKVAADVIKPESIPVSAGTPISAPDSLIRERGSFSSVTGCTAPESVKNKKKTATSNRKAKLNKKGIPIITDDFNEIFQDEKKKKKKPKEDFKQLFEKSQLNIYQCLMLMEKKEIEKEIASPILSEQLKAYPRPQEELDLHGYSASKAEIATEFFIRNVRHLKIQTVRIIVGKGIHSEGKAILPDVIEAKIIELKRKGWVLYYKWENKDKRKSGSIIVYLIPLLT